MSDTIYSTIPENWIILYLLENQTHQVGMELCQNVFLFLIVYIEGIIGFDQLAVMETISPSPLTTAGEDTEHLTGSSNSNLSQHIGNLSDSVIVLQVDGVGNEGDEVDHISFDAVADAVTIIIRSPTTSPPQHPFSVSYLQ